MSFELLRILNEVPLVEQIDEVAVFVLTSKSLGAVELWLKLQFRLRGVGGVQVDHLDQFLTTLSQSCILTLSRLSDFDAVFKGLVSFGTAPI